MEHPSQYINSILQSKENIELSRQGYAGFMWLISNYNKTLSKEQNIENSRIAVARGWEPRP